MYEATVTLTPASPNLPLLPLWVMRYAAGKLLFSGLPSALTAAVFVFVPATGSPVVLAIDITAADGTGTLTIENGATTEVGQGDYYVYGFVGVRIFGLGAGKITVTSAPTLDASAGVTPVGNQISVYNPSTGLYHLLVAASNELGEVTITLAQEGTPNV